MTLAGALVASAISLVVPMLLLAAALPGSAMYRRWRGGYWLRISDYDNQISRRWTREAKPWETVEAIECYSGGAGVLTRNGHEGILEGAAIEFRKEGQA